MSRAASRPSYGTSRSVRTPSAAAPASQAGPPFGIGAVAERVLDLGVDHEQSQSVGGQVEGDLALGEIAGVEVEGVALGAAGGRHLVHDPAGHAHEVVLGALAENRQLGAESPSSKRSFRASAVTTSSAAEEDRPAPVGTVEVSWMSAPVTGW